MTYNEHTHRLTGQQESMLFQFYSYLCVAMASNGKFSVHVGGSVWDKPFISFTLTFPILHQYSAITAILMVKLGFSTGHIKGFISI